MREAAQPELEVLREVTTAVVRERDVRRLLERVIDILGRRMGMLRGTFTILEGDELRIEASSRGLNAEERALGRYRLGEGITPVGGVVGKKGLIAVKAALHRRFAPQKRKAVFQRGMKGFHGKAPGVRPVNRGDVQPGGDGKEQPRGVGIALYPFGLRRQGGKIYKRQTFAQKIPAGGAQHRRDLRVGKQSVEFASPLLCGRGGNKRQAHVGSLFHLPTLPLELLQRQQIRGKLFFMNSAGGRSDADPAAGFQKFGINHVSSKKRFKKPSTCRWFFSKTYFSGYCSRSARRRA